MATLAIRNYYDKAQNTKSVLPPYYRTSDSAGKTKLKWGHLRARSHLKMLFLFDLYALPFGFMFGLFLKDPTPESGELLGKQQ